MLNKPGRIKRIWNAKAVGLSDSAAEGEQSDYDLFLEEESRMIRRRLSSWVGTEAYADAGKISPVVPNRAEAIIDAELYLLHVAIITKIGRDNTAGIVTDFETPSGVSVSLDVMTDEGRRNAVEFYTALADRTVDEWKVI